MIIENVNDRIAAWGPSIPLTTAACLVLGLSPYLVLPLDGAVGMHEHQRLVQIIFLALCGILLILRLGRAARVLALPSKQVLLPLLAFFVFGSLSAALAHQPRLGLYEVANFFLLICVSWLVADEMSTQYDRRLNHLLLLCALGSFLYLYHLAINYAAYLINAVQPSPKDLIHGFDNFRFFNHTQTVTLPLLCLVALRYRPHRALHWLCFGIASTWWAIIYLTSARGTFAGIVVGVAVTLLLSGRAAGRWWRMLFVTALVGIVVYLMLFRQLPLALGFQPVDVGASTIHRTLSDPTSHRLPLWTLALDLINRQPLLGVGPLHFAHYTTNVHNAAHPHSWILQLASEWGLLALLMVLIVIALGFRRLLLKGRQLAEADDSNRVVLCAWLTIGIGLLVDGLVSGNIVMPVSQLWIALYIGCAFGWVQSVARADSEGKKGRLPLHLKSALIVSLATALVLLGAGVLPELVDFEGFHDQASRTFPGMYHPRIWLRGHF